MAEKKMQTCNIKLIADILNESGLTALKDGFIESEKKIKDFLDGKLPSVTDKAYEVAKERDLHTIGKDLKKVYEYVINL